MVEMEIGNTSEQRIEEVRSIAIRNETELWFTDPVRRYDMQEHTLETYRVQDGRGNEIDVFALYVSSRNELWALGKTYVNSQTRLYLLSYSVEFDRMEIVPDEAGVLDQKWYGFAAQSLIAEGQNGEIWFVYGGYLFRYEQETGISLEIAGRDHDINISGRSIVVTDQNDIWFVAEILVEGPEFFNGLYRKGQSVIFRFNPESETLQDFGSPPGYPSPRSSFHPFSLYMNSRGQLWADDLGWLEPDSAGRYDVQDWFVAIKSPIFISDRSGGAFQYSWVTPTIAGESNGKMWFASRTGIGELDMESGQWCLIAGFPVWDIAIDSVGGIWTVYNNRVLHFSDKD
ncbi:MAG: hypothetical protein HYU84_12870 [Chloroflexi bacterium]|nr:hypothetical protein [Chloroflexota bacterium]